MDIRSGFHNLRMHKDSIKYTACDFPGQGIYEWLVMPFGLSNAPGAMQSLMRYLLGNLERNNNVILYLDDILVHSKIEQEHDEILEKVLSTLEENNIHLKPSKCAIKQKEIDFLGFHLSNQTYSPMTSTLEGISNYPLPSNIKQWQRFHGMINFYRLHYPRFSDDTRPISSILGLNNDTFDKTLPNDNIKTSRLKNLISNDQEILKNSFETIKNFIKDKTIPLKSIDENKPIFITTDASNVGWGSIISQSPDNSLLPIAWLSGTFSDEKRGWHSIEKEIFALIQTLTKYKELLGKLNYPITIFTDSAHLSSWTNLNITTARHARWNEILSSFNLKLQHIPGENNIVADALSRSTIQNNKAWEGKIFPSSVLSIYFSEIPEEQDRKHISLLLKNGETKALYKNDTSQQLLQNQGLQLKQIFDDNEHLTPKQRKRINEQSPNSHYYRHQPHPEKRKNPFPHETPKRIKTLQPCKDKCTCIQFLGCGKTI